MHSKSSASWVLASTSIVHMVWSDSSLISPVSSCWSWASTCCSSSSLEVRSGNDTDGGPDRDVRDASPPPREASPSCSASTSGSASLLLPPLFDSSAIVFFFSQGTQAAKKNRRLYTPGHQVRCNITVVHCLCAFGDKDTSLPTPHNLGDCCVQLLGRRGGDVSPWLLRATTRRADSQVDALLERRRHSGARVAEEWHRWALTGI